MTQGIPSRSFGIKGFVAPGTPTLADALLAIDRAPDLRPGQRADLKSALRAICRVLGFPPDAVPAHPAFLRQKLAKIAPAAHGIALPRWANIKSLLIKALGLLGVRTLPGRHMAPHTASWRSLYGAIADRSTRLGLSRLSRFASAQRIEPDEVNDQVLADFLTALEQESLVGDPRLIWRGTLTSWNRAVVEVPGWPQLRLQPPVLSYHYGLDMSNFPASLAVDVEAWLTHLAGAEFLTQLGFKPLRPATLRHRREQIRQLASAQVMRGRDAATIVNLAALIQPDAVREAMRFFHARAGERKTGRMPVLGHVVTGIARHWAKLPSEQIALLQAMTKACDPGHTGLTSKNRSVLRSFSTKEAKRKLIELPFTLLASIKSEPPWSGRDALTVQTALLVQLLLRAPMRVSNVAGLRFDQHVTQMGGANSKLVLVIPGDETKNRVELVHPLLGATADLWHLYLNCARPQLVTGATPFVFPGADDAARGRSTRAIRSQMVKASQRFLGVEITPHQYRHLAGKILLDARPGCHELVRALLGDKSINTILRHYAGLEQEAAVEHYDEVLEELRRNGKKKA